MHLQILKNLTDKIPSHYSSYLRTSVPGKTMEQIFLEIILRYMENKDMIAVTAREVKDASD